MLTADVHYMQFAKTDNYFSYERQITRLLKLLSTSTSKSLILLFKHSFCAVNESLRLEISFTLFSRLCIYCK